MTLKIATVWICIAIGSVIALLIGYVLYDDHQWESSDRQLSYLEDRLPGIECKDARGTVLTREDTWQDWFYETEFQASPRCLRSVDQRARATGFVERDGALFRDFGNGYDETIRIIPERSSIRWERSQI